MIKAVREDNSDFTIVSHHHRTPDIRHPSSGIKDILPINAYFSEILFIFAPQFENINRNKNGCYYIKKKIKEKKTISDYESDQDQTIECQAGN